MDIDTVSLKRGPSCFTPAEDSGVWEASKKTMLQPHAYTAPSVLNQFAPSETSMLAHKAKLAKWYHRGLQSWISEMKRRQVLTDVVPQASMHFDAHRG